MIHETAGRRRALTRRELAGLVAALLASAVFPGCGDAGPSSAGAASSDSARAGTELHGTVIPGGRAKGEWTLTATDGQPFDFREETAGQVTLLFFGYTHCPNTCPVQMATLGAAYEKLSWDVQRRIEVLFVTTDPARDTLARLRSWLDNFSDDFVGLRGSREKVDSIMASYGLPAAQVDSTPPGPGSPGDGYTVNHAGQILVFTPDNELRLMYPTGVRQREWVSDLRTLTRVGAAAATVSPTASGESSGAGGPGPDGSTANGPP